MRAAVVGLATVVLGLSAGGLLAEALLLVPWWRAMEPEAFLAWYPEHADSLFRFFAPLEIGAGVLTVLATAAAWRGDARLPLGVAAGLSVAVLLAFPLYFGAANTSFVEGTLAPGDVATELARWSAWHWGRTVLALVAFAAGAFGLRRLDRAAE